MWKRKLKHWALRAREVSISRDEETNFNITVEGGADNAAQFVFLGKIRQERIVYNGRGKLQKDDIILETNGKRVSGLILRDVISLIRERSPDCLFLRVTEPGKLTTTVYSFRYVRFVYS